MATDAIIHKFEQAGLGKAPFRFVGVEIRKYQACVGAPIQPGAACDYCGTGIMECCIIRSSDGKQFVVGNECVKKTDDAGLINLTKRAVNKARAEARHVAEKARIDAARSQLASEPVRTALASQPHPNTGEYFASKTLLDWAEWMMDHSGNSGRMRVARLLAKQAT